MFSLRKATVLAVISILLPSPAQALSFKLKAHKAHSATKSTRRTGPLDARQDPGPLELDNLYDLYYSTFITVNGQELEVQLDTGSSELWVRPKSAWTTGVNETTTNLSIRYGIGNFDGAMTTADVALGDSHIPGQRFLTYKQGAINNVFQAGLDGMMGLGFDNGSTVYRTVSRTAGDTSGRTLLSNFFDANPSVPRTMSFYMSRNNDPQSDQDGLFMVGEPEPEYAAVTTAPAIPVHVNTHANDFQRWSTYVEAVEVNGVNITGAQSVVDGVAAGRYVANIDTGTSLAWVPKNIADAIYKDIPGAQYFEDTNQYTVPCLSAPRIALWIGGQRFAIHPQDATRVQSQTGQDGKREYFCTNTFLYTPALSQQSHTLDMQLGDSFLRNVIAQYDFGDPANYATANIRMVTTTSDELAALNSFNAVRSAQVGLAAPPIVTELPGGGGTTTSGANPTATFDPSTGPTPSTPPGAPPTVADSDSTNNSNGNSNNSSPEENKDDSALQLVAAPTLVLAVLLSSVAAFAF